MARSNRFLRLRAHNSVDSWFGGLIYKAIRSQDRTPGGGTHDIFRRGCATIKSLY